jgi:hypothetical protein
VTPRTSSALGAALERAILRLLEKGIPEGGKVEEDVEFTDKEWETILSEAPEGAEEVDPLVMTGRRDDEWSEDTFFHLASKRAGGALESFFLPVGKEVTPGIVSAILGVSRDLRLGEEAGGPLAEPHDLSGSLEFWRVAALHTR